jgi:hypothetical protein
MQIYKSLIPLVFLVIFSCNTNQNTKQEIISIEVVPPTIKIEPNGIIIGKLSEPDTLKGSLPAYAKGKIDDTEVLIEYYSPAVRGRIIWGGLVPLNQVWVTGAHMATTIEFDTPLIFAETPVDAGKYALFTIPGENRWTFILNKNWKQHLADKYDIQEDVLRINVQVEETAEHQERLRYFIEENKLKIHWEKKQINIPLSLVKN